MAVEYRQSADKVKHRIDELTEEIKRHKGTNGAHDSVGLKLIERRYQLRKICLELSTTAYKLEHYYDKTAPDVTTPERLANSMSKRLT